MIFRVMNTLLCMDNEIRDLFANATQFELLADIGIIIIILAFSAIFYKQELSEKYETQNLV